MRKLKLHFSIVFSLSILFVGNSNAQNNCDYLGFVSSAFGHRPIVYINVISSVEENDSIERGETIGVIAPLPDKLSQQYDRDIQRSKSLYQQGRFLLAHQVLEVALTHDSDNPFILNESARALYWIDSLKTQSFEIYKRLIDILDETGRAQERVEGVYVNMWFIEAYWKIGTLYMDLEEHNNALYEIHRALTGLAGQGHPQLLEQAYSYMTKAYYKVGNRDASECYAKETLAINPRNTFIKPYRSQFRKD
jgi:tetratricopeptide (TPR) repeat protein